MHECKISLLQNVILSCWVIARVNRCFSQVTMVTTGVVVSFVPCTPGCVTDQLLTGLIQSQILKCSTCCTRTMSIVFGEHWRRGAAEAGRRREAKGPLSAPLGPMTQTGKGGGQGRRNVVQVQAVLLQVQTV